MQSKNLLLTVLSLIAIVFGLNACAGRPYLIVDYRIPDASQRLTGHTVRLNIKDLRQDTAILSATAAAEFEGFKNRYSLAWLNKDGSRILAGEHNLENLFREAFKKRLELLGATVTEDFESQAPVFEVVLRRFQIDLQNRTWFADVSYEANLSKDSQLIARENITGSAERLRIIGRKGADTVLSDIFSDILNKVNIIKLFAQAKLIS